MPTALITGASRGVGRGVAMGLAAEGFEVFATGRSIEQADLPAAITRVHCDHTRDAETADAFARVGRLDLLVNCVWGGYETMLDENGAFVWQRPFWEEPARRWSGMMEAGVRAALVCSGFAARLMVAQGGGLIVNVSYWAARKYMGNVVYGIAKAATDKMSADMAVELRSHGVHVVTLYPGLVRTEAVLQAAEGGWLDLSNSESPEFIGRVIAALAGDAAIGERSGQVIVAAEAAMRYGIRDIDGRQPVPLTLDSA